MTAPEEIAAVLEVHAEYVHVGVAEWRCTCRTRLYLKSTWENAHRTHVAEVLATLMPVATEVIETVETVLGFRGELGLLEPLGRGRSIDTRATPLLTLRRTVRWTESVVTEWEVVGDGE